MHISCNPLNNPELGWPNPSPVSCILTPAIASPGLNSPPHPWLQVSVIWFPLANDRGWLKQCGCSSPQHEEASCFLWSLLSLPPADPRKTRHGAEPPKPQPLLQQPGEQFPGSPSLHWPNPCDYENKWFCFKPLNLGLALCAKPWWQQLTATSLKN